MVKYSINVGVQPSHIYNSVLQEKMPMTAAERQAKCRAKLKESREKYAEHKKKNVQYQMKSRCKKKERESSLPNRDQKLI